MDVVIKKATLDDLKTVQKLNLKLFEKEHKEYDSLLNMDRTFSIEGIKYYQNRISKEDGCVLIAIVNNKIVGYLCGGMSKWEAYRHLPLVAELENTFVLEEFRSQWIGCKLYNTFVKWCTKKNGGKIRVQASAQNEWAIRFYRNNNFKDYALILETDL